MRIFFIVTFFLVLISCKKNSGNGNNNNSDPLEGRFIIKTEQLCFGQSFVGHELGGNLIDQVMAITFSDTLNSWYINKSGNGYLIYARFGSDYLLWKEGAPVVINIGIQYELLLFKTSSLPRTPAPEYIFSIEGTSANGYVIRNISSQHRAVSQKGGLKGASECTRQSALFLSSSIDCVDAPEGAKIYTICFKDKLFLQKIK